MSGGRGWLRNERKKAGCRIKESSEKIGFWLKSKVNTWEFLFYFIFHLQFAFEIWIINRFIATKSPFCYYKNPQTCYISIKNPKPEISSVYANIKTSKTRSNTNKPRSQSNKKTTRINCTDVVATNYVVDCPKERFILRILSRFREQLL